MKASVAFGPFGRRTSFDDDERFECPKNGFVDRDDVTKRDTPTAGGIQQMLNVNESGYIHIAYDAEECNTWPFI